MNSFFILLALAAIIGGVVYLIRRNRRDAEPRNPMGDRDDGGKPGRDRL